MIGAIIGDIVGSCYEFNNIKTERFELFNKKSTFTDDTVMTIAVAVGIMKNHNNPEATRDDVIDAMQDFGNTYYRAGYGYRFFWWLINKSREPYNSYGNGSAMRVSSVAWWYDTLEDVER